MTKKILSLVLLVLLSSGCGSLYYHRVLTVNLEGEDVKTPYGKGSADIKRVSEIIIGDKKCRHSPKR